MEFAGHISGRHFNDFVCINRRVIATFLTHFCDIQNFVIFNGWVAHLTHYTRNSIRRQVRQSLSLSIGRQRGNTRCDDRVNVYLHFVVEYIGGL